MLTDEEKLCESCDETWPADSQFWFKDKSRPDGLSYCCKACYYENVRPPDYRRKTPVEVGRLTDELALILTPLPVALPL